MLSQRATFKGVFQRDGKFLFVKESNGNWEMPGGKVELGEQLEACFSREMSEELGWFDVRMEKVAHVWTLFGERQKIQYIVICATATPKDTPITLSHEHTEYGWFTPSELQTMNVLPGFLETVKKLTQ